MSDDPRPSRPRSSRAARRARWLPFLLAVAIVGPACAPATPPFAPEAPSDPAAYIEPAPHAEPAAMPPVSAGATTASRDDAANDVASVVGESLQLPVNVEPIGEPSDSLAAAADGHERALSPGDPEIDPGRARREVAPAPVPAPVRPGQSVLVPPVAVPPPLVQGPAAPNSGCELPPPAERGRSWRDPLPQAPRYNPDGPKRVGLQAGHWLTERVPAELRGLQHGASGGGKMEWEVNLDLARRTRSLLEAHGIEVDVLPTTVPVRYRAHVFVSIHADGDTTGQLRGFKIARPAFSSLPAVDDRLVGALYEGYGATTSLRRDDGNITSRMRFYYAFNSRRFCHAVAPGVPQAIVETGFLTNAADRQLLLGNPDVVARGIAVGILRFLHENP